MVHGELLWFLEVLLLSDTSDSVALTIIMLFGTCGLLFESETKVLTVLSSLGSQSSQGQTAKLMSRSNGTPLDRAAS